MVKKTLLDEYMIVLDSVRSYVEDQLELGFSELPGDEHDKESSDSLFGMTESRTKANFNTMEDIRKAVEACQACPLHKTRMNVVFGTGNENTKLVFVGEAPGADEDQQGKPFVGKAGQKLTQIINAMGQFPFVKVEKFMANINLLVEQNIED